MTKEKVDLLLSNHRENVGRCLHLQAEIAELQSSIADAERNLATDLAWAHSYELSDMPHGTAVSQPTEKIGLQLASGWKPDYIVTMQQRLAECEREQQEREINRMFVDGWLKGLPDRERWLIENQVIDKVFWRDILIRYRQRFETDLSKDTLQRVKARALEQIYAMAR